MAEATNIVSLDQRLAAVEIVTTILAHALEGIAPGTRSLIMAEVERAKSGKADQADWDEVSAHLRRLLPTPAA